MDQTTPTTELLAKLTKQQILDRCNRALDEYRSRLASIEEDRARLLVERRSLTEKTNTLERELRHLKDYNETLQGDLRTIAVVIESMLTTVHGTGPQSVPSYLNGIEQQEPVSQEVRFLRHLWNRATSHCTVPF